MKKLFTTVLLAGLFIIVKAQPVLYGLTSNNNYNHNNGTLIKYEAATNTLSASVNLPNVGINPLGAYGTYPYGSLLQASDGKLYGMTLASISRAGFIFSFDPVTSVFTNLRNFDSAGGSQPYGSLIEANNGKLYGMTAYGGTTNAGVIFSFDPVTSAYVKLKDFDGIIGTRPYGSLLQASDGKFYGLTSTGGSNGAGVIFSYDPATFTYSKLKDFDGSNGRNPYGSLLQASDGKLYGLTSAGGAVGFGVIFSFSPSTSTYTKLKDFDNTSGANPYGSLIQASNGKLYGLTSAGGSAAYGIIFSFDPVTSAYTKLKDFGATDGNYPYGSLLQASDGRFYGMTHDGGSSGPFASFGDIFSYDPANAAYTVSGNFVGNKGGSPYYGALTELRTITTSALPKNNYCAGSSLTVAYTATGTYKAGNIFTAQLSDASGSFTSAVNIGSAATTTSGIINAVIPANTPAGVAYRIRVVSGNPVVTGSDNGSNITINPLPVVTLAPFPDVCSTAPAFVLTGGSPAGGVYSGKGVSNNQFDPTVTGLGTFTIYYTFTSSAGCVAVAKQSINVTKTCVTCQASISAMGPTTFCQGGIVVLTASAGVSYLWSNGETKKKITVSTGGTYAVRITDANNCVTTSAAVVVTVNALPATPVITAGSNPIFCIPGSVTLSTGAASSYLWSNGATTQSTTVTTSGTYTVMVTNAAGCSAVSSGMVVTAKKCFLYCAAAGASNSKGYIQTVVTSNGIKNNSGWNNGYGDFSSFTGTSLLTSSFDITISPGFITSSSKLALYTKLWIDWNQNGDFSDAGELVFATANGSNLDVSTSITVPKTALTGNTRMRIIMSTDAATSWCGSFKYGEAEDYTISITSSSARIASGYAGGYIDKEPAANDYSVFPNPATQKLMVQRSGNNPTPAASEDALIQLTDANGKILRQTRFLGLSQYVDVSRYTNGIYFLQIKTSRYSTIKKIFIQH